MSLRPEQLDDESFLLNLYASTRAAEMQLIPWDEAQKEDFLRSQFALQVHHYRKYYPDAAFLIVERDARSIGRLYVDRSGPCVLVIDIALLPEYRGAGIGGRLMEEVLSGAAAVGKAVHIHVETSNRARKLYERLGFHHIEDKGIYILMEWSPNQSATM